MKIGGIIQIAILLLLLASAASCGVSKEYFHRTFSTTQKNRTDTLAIKFMPADSMNTSVVKELPDSKNETEKTKPGPVIVENNSYGNVQAGNTLRTKRKRTSSL